MKWGALFGWGIVIYAVVFLAWNVLVIHAFVEGIWPRLILAAVLVATVVPATRSLRLYRWYDVLPYSIGWTLIAACFDLVCAVPVSGLAIWSDWNIWVGYALLLLVPLITPPPRYRRDFRGRF